MNERLRSLPSVDEVLARPAVRALADRVGRPAAKAAVRTAIAEAREKLQRGGEEGTDHPSATCSARGDAGHAAERAFLVGCGLPGSSRTKLGQAGQVLGQPGPAISA